MTLRDSARNIAECVNVQWTFSAFGISD
jgi:hypothetical protein